MVLANFIVIEGLDGAGTTTQADMLYRRCQAENKPAFLTREPTDHAAGILIRGILRKETAALPQTLAYLFAADRNQHVNAPGGIRTRAENGELVICDRYLFSSLAYQSVDCGWQTVRALNADFPLPEYLVFLDIQPAEGAKRLQNRAQREIFEYEAFQAQAAALYKRALEEYSGSGMKILVIDALETPENIHEKIRRFVSA